MSNIFQKIKSEFLKTAEILEKFDETASDNVLNPSEISVDKLAIGGKIQKINSDGTLTDLSDGDYTIDNDNQDKVTIKDGLISALNGETASEETPAEDTKSEDLEDETTTEETPATTTDNSDLEAKIQDLENRVATLESYFSDFKKEFNSNTNASKKLEDSFSKLNETIEKLAKIPATASVKENTFSKQKAQTNYEKFLEGLKK